MWYYTGVEMSDHNDFAGVPTLLKGLAKFFRHEFRAQYFINIYNRVRGLKFDELDHHKTFV